jgi:hypothetical protein
MKFAGEKQLSAATSLHLGLGFFYGWVVTHDFKQSSVGVFTDDIGLDGYTWGINASVGGTVKFSRLTLEPFISGGYCRLKLDGDGDATIGAGTITGLWSMDQKRAEWSIGGGFSIKF